MKLCNKRILTLIRRFPFRFMTIPDVLPCRMFNPKVIRGRQHNFEQIFQIWALMRVNVQIQPVVIIIISLLLILSARKHILRK